MWARIDLTIVRELVDTDPVGRFHPSLEWQACDDTVALGDVYVDGVFSTPPPVVPTSAQLISELEASITPRNLRGAALGEAYSIAKITDVEAQINALR